MLVIALCKGRYLQPSLAMLSRAGVSFIDDPESSRKLIFESTDAKYRAVLVKPADVPTYVEYGAADVGIAGRDVVMESRADILQPLDLNFGHCRIAVAAPQGVRSLNGSDQPGVTTRPGAGAPELGEGDAAAAASRHHVTIRVATKYPHITLDYFNARGIPVEIIPLSGAIELAPLIGLADRIVDLVETGRTLRENGLEILEVIAESSARLLINRAGYQTKRKEVFDLIQSLEKAVR